MNTCEVCDVVIKNKKKINGEERDLCKRHAQVERQRIRRQEYAGLPWWLRPDPVPSSRRMDA